jgi:VWFA-related protein
MHRILIAVSLAAGLAAALSAQTQTQPAQSQTQPAQPQAPPVQPRFRVEINYVDVDAVVTDAQGNFVRNLTRDDFEVLEDGKPQQVTAFSVVDLPLEREEAPLLAPNVVPDVSSNARAFDGRIYLIILDDLHTAALRTPRVKLAAKQFIERYVGANDLAAVVSTGGRSEASQDFTNSRPRLLRAVDHFMGQKPRSATLEKLEEYNMRRGTPAASDPLKDPYEFERALKARNMLDTLENAARWMANIQGRRKAIVMIGEGIDYDTTNPFDNREATVILDDLRETIAAATRSNVTIYAVDPRGLTTGGDEGIELSGVTEDPSMRLDMVGLQNELRVSQDSLRTLAGETGGFAVVNQNDFKTGFDRIHRDNSTYYMLGYYSSNERRDGRYRKIQVRVKRPDLMVRARRGYVAPRSRDERPAPAKNGGLSAELSEALTSPVPVSGLAMTVTAAPFKGTAPNASVLVTIEVAPGQLPFKEQNGTMQNEIELTTFAFDRKGKVKGAPAAKVDLKLQPRTHAAVVARGLRLTQRLALPPGQHTVRVGARELTGGGVGTLSYDLDVPDFYKNPLSMSGVVLTSKASGARPTAVPDSELKDILPGPPTAQREFVAGDTMAAFAEVYDTQGNTPHKIDITATVNQDGGRRVFAHSEERGTDELQGARGGFGYRVDIPLQDFAPGDYVLTVEARSRLSGNPTVRQDIPFRVRGGQ